jgi:hypothetical protein
VDYSRLPIFILIRFWEIRKFLTNGLCESACLQRVIEMHLENLNGDRTHQNKLLFHLPFFRKLKFMLEFIFTVFRVIESFMDGMVKEQRLRTKKVNAK